MPIASIVQYNDRICVAAIVLLIVRIELCLEMIASNRSCGMLRKSRNWILIFCDG